MIFLGGEGGRSRLLAFYIFVVASVSLWRGFLRKLLWTSSYCHRAKIWVIVSVGDGYLHSVFLLWRVFYTQAFFLSKTTRSQVAMFQQFTHIFVF